MHRSRTLIIYPFLHDSFPSHLPKPHIRNKLHNRSKNLTNHLPKIKEKKTLFLTIMIVFLLVLEKNCSTLLAFSCPHSATGATASNAPKISIIEDQRQVVGFITIIYGGDTDARASFQRCKESSRNAIDEPHSHPIKLATPG